MRESPSIGCLGEKGAVRRFLFVPIPGAGHGLLPAFVAQGQEQTGRILEPRDLRASRRPRV